MIIKHLSVALLCALCGIGASGQGVTELLQNLEIARSDSAIIASYGALISHYRDADIDSARLYATEGLVYAQQAGYARGEGVMLTALAQIDERHGFLDRAKKAYADARLIFNRLGYTKGVAGSTNGLGVVAGRTGQYHEATRHFLEALKLFQQIDDTAGVVQTYIKLGVVSDFLGNLDDALNYYLKAEALNVAPPSSNASLTLLNNIGVIYGKRNDIPTALGYFHKGLRASNPKKSTAIHITLLGSLGTAYERSGNTDSANYFQQQALSMAKQGNYPEEEARALVNISSLFRKTDPAKSLELLREALAITERIQQLSLMTEVYESMINLYKEQHDYKEAMQLSEKRQLLKDSMFSLQKAKEIANLHANQELAQQEGEIRSLALQNEKSMIQRNIMIIVVLIVIALMGIAWYYNTQISALNKRLMIKQTELKKSNTIKDKLFSILGHDLRSPLSRVIGLLNVLGTKQMTEDESIILEKLRHQSLHTLETLDNLLVWGRSQLKGVHLSQQTFTVKDQIKKSIHLTADYAAQKNILVVDHVPADTLVYADPSHFDFVIRNLLSNAIKFSHAGGTIVISADNSIDKQTVLSINDSGVGIRKDLQFEIFSSGNESARGTWNEKGTGIGLMLCREFITENGGKLWVESNPGSGSTFSFSLLQKETSGKPQMETA